jgi:riboflavin kinase/FMN adenylyltransferase
LICEAVRLAEEKSLKSVVYTFDRHPRTVLGFDVEYITNNTEKEALIRETGADILYFQKTDIEFLKLSPYDFAESLLKNTLNAGIVVVGEHYTFGAEGAGDTKKLEELGKALGFEVMVLPLIKKEGRLVSSTNIRKLLADGDVKTANVLLGRNFSLCGTVEDGNRIGRTLGFPTVNIYPEKEQVLPLFGVYAADAVVDGVKYKAVLNAGVKPTVGSDRVVIESHLFDVSEDFYGKKVKIYFKEFIRPEKKFANLDELKAQIEEDKKIAKKDN